MGKKKTSNLLTISKTIRILIIHFRHKNLKYQYVTIKIHSTISKLKKVRLKIALKVFAQANFQHFILHSKSFHSKFR